MILTEAQIAIARRYNSGKDRSSLIQAVSPPTVLYAPTSTDFSQATATFQHNNRITADGKFGVVTASKAKPRVGGVLYLDQLPRVRSGTSITGEQAIDHEFVEECKTKGMLGRSALLVCSYSGTDMTKRPGDFFGLDGTTLGWPHFAAGTLRRYYDHIATEHPNVTAACCPGVLQDDFFNPRWRKKHIVDSPHNGGLFQSKAWRIFGIKIAHNFTLREAQSTVWRKEIWEDGLTYWQTIGLKSELGLALCVRYRNSQKMSRSVKSGAKRALSKGGEEAAIEYIQEKYTKNWTRRMNRIKLMNRMFSPHVDVTEPLDETH